MCTAKRVEAVLVGCRRALVMQFKEVHQIPRCLQCGEYARTTGMGERMRVWLGGVIVCSMCKERVPPVARELRSTFILIER